MTTTETRIVKTVTIPEGMVVRQYEQTASRDHNLTLVPGTYPVTARYYPEPGKTIAEYHARIPGVAHDHTRSTVEFGGVALASEQRGGETETYWFQMYASDYFVNSAEQSGYVFGYDA